ncbi:ABC transporter substrate-binding protein [Spiribacter onubensis]|uniref:ABC transporter substrate-binding protein n=1 Tax=Spiribacter onubensis TaxID=3122420 RepID=A0ABV3SA64_9GAMM
MNLCTDQLAMLVAGEGQLASVSALSRDPISSAIADQAQAYPVNHGRAEEIHLLDPDLVIAGRFSAGATVAMLKRLGIPVAVFEPATSLDDVRRNLLRMGELLGRTERARELVEAFDRRVAMLSGEPLDPPEAALYFPNGYTRGEDTLVGDIVRAAGFNNIASGLGVAGGGHLPLEQLVVAEPELVITGSRNRGYSRSQAIMQHPVLDEVARFGARRGLVNREWVCGTPRVLAAIERIGALRGELVGSR